MKIIVAVVLLVFGWADMTLASEWKHFGADPAYKSRELAIADAPRVLKQAGYPAPVVELLVEAMKKPGKETRIVNGETLDFMRSGPKELWVNVKVAFVTPPVSDQMEYAAPAEEWSVEYRGTTWTVLLPRVCNNLAGKKSRVAQEECVEARATVKPTKGDRYLRIGIIADKPMPASGCFGVKAPGATDFVTPPVRCPDRPCDFSQPVAEIGKPLQYSWGYEVVQEGEYILRMPAKAADKVTDQVVVLCLEREGDIHSCGMDVWWFDFMPVNGTKTATLYYDQVAAGGAQDSLGRPTWLWWKWFGKDDCYRPHGQQ